MEITVPGMEDVPDHQAMLGADLLDVLESGREFGARDHSVLDVIGRRHSTYRAERVLPSRP